MHGGISEHQKRHHSHRHISGSNNNSLYSSNNNIKQFCLNEDNRINEHDLENLINESLNEWQQQQQQQMDLNDEEFSNSDPEVDQQTPLISENASKALSRTFSHSLC